MHAYAFRTSNLNTYHQLARLFMSTVLTCVFDVERQPKEKCVADQLVEEQSKGVLNNSLHRKK